MEHTARPFVRQIYRQFPNTQVPQIEAPDNRGPLARSSGHKTMTYTKCIALSFMLLFGASTQAFSLATSGSDDCKNRGKAERALTVGTLAASAFGGIFAGPAAGIELVGFLSIIAECGLDSAVANQTQITVAFFP
jgi:hypothetical protein